MYEYKFVSTPFIFKYLKFDFLSINFIQNILKYEEKIYLKYIM
jgi:hypothetical protein